MEAEVKRLARRGLGDWRDVKPRRIDEQTLVYPYRADFAALAAAYLRTPSRCLHDLFSTRAPRLEPLYDEVVQWVRDEGRGYSQPGLHDPRCAR